MLLAGQQDNFAHVLATNIEYWGYEAVVLPSLSKSAGSEIHVLEGDILLYDIDQSFYRAGLSKYSSAIQQQVVVAEILHDYGLVYVHTRLTIVLSSLSVSRAMVERMGAVALLLKPFAMDRLQRYLRVLQRVILAEAHEEGLEARVSGLDDRIRVLVVDDDVDGALTVCQCLLYEPGFAVAVAHDGLAALEQCLSWQPHCVVTDLIMPWMNGYQVMRCLSAGSSYRMPGFVVMSALTHREGPMHHSYMGENVVAYVDKPFHIDHLLTAIKQVCAG